MIYDMLTAIVDNPDPWVAIFVLMIVGGFLISCGGASIFGAVVFFLGMMGLIFSLGGLD